MNIVKTLILKIDLQVSLASLVFDSKWHVNEPYRSTHKIGHMLRQNAFAFLPFFVT